MNNFLLFFLPFLVSIPIGAESGPDFLRFKNGDTLHGQYQGLDEGPLVRWMSKESRDPIHFEIQNIRKLSLNNGRAKNHLVSSGLVVLNNGDNIPCSLIGMGEDSVSVQTEFAGLLTIPREHIERISPNRLGGGVLYAGPFNDEDWSTPGGDVVEESDKKPKEEGDKKSPATHWVHGGGAWYSNSSEILRLNKSLPDQVSIRFRLAWQSPLNANIAVFGDFRRPKRAVGQGRVRRMIPLVEEAADDIEAEEEVEEEPPEFVDIIKEGAGSSESDSYGSGYLISILSSYSRLQRLDFDENFLGKKTSFPSSGGRLNLGDLFSAEFEIRADREEGKLTLFVNGEFYSEWQDLAEPLGDAERYFAISSGGKSRLRISDVVVAEWNGMPDSARSMQTEERDVLLLANGIDRFSGKILTLEEDVFRVESDYGIFQVPTREVTDIHLATDTVALPPDPEDGEIKVSFQPNGLLTLSPKEGQSHTLQGRHSILGDLSLDLRYAYLLEFDAISSIFDNWDDEF